MAEDKANVNQQVEWNQSQFINIEMAKMREKSNSFFLQRNLQSSAEALMCLRMTSTHVYSKTELEDLVSLEIELLNLIAESQYEPQGFGVKEDVEKKIKNRKELYAKFINYNNKLTKLLDFYGFLGNRKSDKTKLVA